MQDLLNIHRITQDDLRLMSIFCSLWELSSMQMNGESKFCENLFKKRFFEELSSFMRMEELIKLGAVFQKLGTLSHNIDLDSMILFDLPKLFVSNPDINDDYSRCLIN